MFVLERNLFRLQKEQKCARSLSREGKQETTCRRIYASIAGVINDEERCLFRF